MGQELIGHRCTICRKVFKTRKRTKEHISSSHPERINIKRGPGQHSDYIWLDLEKEGRKYDKNEIGSGAR